MKVKRKLMGLAVVILTMCQVSIPTFASELTTDEYVNTIIQQSNEQEILERALNGIDDVYDDLGVEIKVSTIFDNAKMRALTTNDVINNVQTYKTSKYLGSKMNNNNISEDIYEVSTIQVYASNPSASDTQGHSGCTIVTTVYGAWSSNGMSMRLVNSKATISGSLLPTKLVMGNKVYEGWDTNKTHFGSRTVNSPSAGSYTLGSCYSGYVIAPGSYIAASDTVSFGSGGSVTTYTSLAPGI